MSTPRARAVAAALALAVAGAARAQEFAPASPAGPQPGACALLDRALPWGGGALECSATRWLALADFETRAAAALAAAGCARVALGVAQTGDPQLGWTSAALAAGACVPGAGAALRVVARHDRAAGALAGGRLADGGGFEAGAGAWLEAAPGAVVWAVAPQLVARGEAPPLARPFEAGARCERGPLAAWCALTAPRGGDDGERAFGAALAFGPARAWAEARDGPWRASAGVGVRARSLVVELRADAHPDLGETTRLVLAYRAGGAAP